MRSPGSREQQSSGRLHTITRHHWHHLPCQCGGWKAAAFWIAGRSCCDGFNLLPLSRSEDCTSKHGSLMVASKSTTMLSKLTCISTFTNNIHYPVTTSQNATNWWKPAPNLEASGWSDSIIIWFECLGASCRDCNTLAQTYSPALAPGDRDSLTFEAMGMGTQEAFCEIGQPSFRNSGEKTWKTYSFHMFSYVFMRNSWNILESSMDRWWFLLPMPSFLASVINVIRSLRPNQRRWRGSWRGQVCRPGCKLFDRTDIWVWINTYYRYHF